MIVEEALNFLETLLLPHHLTDVQYLVFRQSWEGFSYPEIAQNTSYDAEYIKYVGFQLWHLLSQALGEKVTKSNLQSVLTRHSQKNPSIASRQTRMVDRDATTYQDWEEVIDVSNFYGRVEELTQLKTWILQEHCRVVTILGGGGIGKTVLSVKLAELIQHRFQYVVWRSLAEGIAATVFFQNLIQVLSYPFGESRTFSPDAIDSLETQITQILSLLRLHSCLLIFDDWETVFSPGKLAGCYQSHYEVYGQLLKRISLEHHQSCLILVSREKPLEIVAFSGQTTMVRTLKLHGLNLEGAISILQTHGFSGTESGIKELVQRYGGYPLALKLAATTIQELFNQNILQFLEQNSLFIGDILGELIRQQIERLSELEKIILYCLAIEEKPISFSDFKAEILGFLSQSKLLIILESLERRSFLEKEINPIEKTICFTLSPLIIKYVNSQLMDHLFLITLISISKFIPAVLKIVPMASTWILMPLDSPLR